MLEVEADCYWCLCKLVEAIQDHYTYAQPGIQRAVFRLQRLVRWAVRGGGWRAQLVHARLHDRMHNTKYCSLSAPRGCCW